MNIDLKVVDVGGLQTELCCQTMDNLVSSKSIGKILGGLICVTLLN